MDENEREKVLNEYRDAVKSMISECRQLLPEENSDRFGAEAMAVDIDFSYMVELRRKHETEQASKATRKRARAIAEEGSADEEADLDRARKSLHAQLMNRFHSIMREDGEEQAVATGASRRICWNSTNNANPGYTPQNTGPLTGNAANAAEVLSAAAKKVGR